MHTVELAMLIGGALVILAILATRVSLRLGVPALVLFLATGMLAGSDGPGGLWFDDPALTWSVGTVALAVLLFAGGLETPMAALRPVLAPGLALATVGVALATASTATFVHLALGWSWLEGALLGGIIASTDAAAVFGALRSAGLHLRGNIHPLLELESGSNDPMAIFLTMTLSAWLAGSTPSWGTVGGGLALQLGLGLAAGWAGGRVIAWALNRLRVPQEGLYPIFALGLAFVTFAATALLGGSGFLAVYVAGLVLASLPHAQQRSVRAVLDALAWLAQIGVFLMLGLLVFPSRLPAVAPEGLAVAAFVVFAARPLAVFMSLTPFRVPWREQAVVAWGGLRGAVPIVLATWPHVVGVPGAERLFDVVFFVVLVSVVVQGSSLAWVARQLGVVAAPDAADPPVA